MKKSFLGIAPVFLAAATPAIATDSQMEDDNAAVIAAFEAINAKQFELAISKANMVIKNFEDGKRSDSIYRCASGLSDNLNTLLGAALRLDQSDLDEGKSVTAAVSDDICSAYFAKGFALIDIGNRDEALPNLQMAVEMDPDNQHYMNELAEWHKVGRDWQTSLDIFTKASETNDLSIALMEDEKQSTEITNSMRCRSYRGIAFNHVEMGNWTDARSAIDECLKLIPDDPGSLQELKYIDAQSVEK
ncbi:tetratricopeptide repeat protein [uncultured Parasphingorhabdus sp.]|uniref:tetratricopeptide repeat protein n=1 Tax=uncultured Parasphingorhabdus sp. TaxID=2709694 RepID=UPI0030DA1B3D|tara:strand:- start:60090 stop:60827 length:738 start_codon:yes stop_codon:yes gene_type:complete